MSERPGFLAPTPIPSSWEQGYHANRELMLFLDGQNKRYLGRIEVWLKIAAIGAVTGTGILAAVLGGVLTLLIR